MATSNANKKSPNFPKVHCFICTQCSYQTEDEKDGPVDPTLAKNFRRTLKKICQHRFPKGHVLINQTTCLGFCKEGISSIIYPKQIVTTSLRTGQEAQIADLIGQLLAGLD
ncbi:MAG: hypothetical protein A2X86_00840 [Bdellovibrionales bacterium GWA2_49_15]|nr:MAG: hypothetical protein A2X86_00840 [Bdellovibrionales bacterium GWA2_49_15]HAZ14592.1 hypothetical protein [Bdellovibrionales bacterium]